MKLAFVLLLAAAAVPIVLTKPTFRSRIPNGANVPNVPAVGHVDPEGSSGSLNVFGKAFDGVGSKWTTTLCQADSDGDGQTNGQELGDPCCVWTASAAAPQRTSGLSDPGQASSTANASQWADLNCSSISTAATTSSSASSPIHTALSTVLVLLFGLAMGTLAARG